jgi:hypothetical protein
MSIVTMGESFTNPVYRDYLGPDEPALEEKRIADYGVPKFVLNHTVAIYYREEFFSDGSKTNLCVAEIANGQHRHRWCGPIIVVSWPGLEDTPTSYQDVTASDLHFAVEFFKCYGGGVGTNEVLLIKGGLDAMSDMFPSLSHILKDRGPTTIECALINSLGDQRVCQKAYYTIADVPIDHEIWTSSPQAFRQIWLFL